LTDPGDEICAPINLKPEEGGNCGTEQDKTDSQETSRNGVCFHAAILIRRRQPVLIEIICRFIEAADLNNDPSGDCAGDHSA
jgi:hypothetical protein